MRAQDSYSPDRRPYDWASSRPRSRSEAASPPTTIRRRWVGGALVACSLVAAVGAPAMARQQRTDELARYVVHQGDTLSAIARRSGVTVEALAAANAIANPNLIVVGRTLVIPIRGAQPGAATTPGPAPAQQPAAAAVSGVGRRHPAGLVGSRLRLMPEFELWARHYGVRPDLLKALCYLESGWQTGAVSPAGAVGVGQLMPDTAGFLSQLIGLPLSRWNVEQNIHMSAKYLRWLLDQTGWNVRTAVGSYYEGLGAMRARGPYPDTVAYVNNVLALQTRF